MAFHLLTIFSGFPRLVRMKGDEDEGSLPQGGANPAAGLWEKIE